MSQVKEAKEFLTNYIEEPQDTLDGDMVRMLLSFRSERISTIMFGAKVDDLDEDQLSEVILWWAGQGNEEDLARHALLRLVLEVAEMATLYGRIDARLDVRPSLGERGYLDAVVDAQLVGTRSRYEAMCEALEESWHDMRLTRDEGVAAVESVERVRGVLRRLEACGVDALSECPGPEGAATH